MKSDIFGLGNALMDIQAFIPDEVIKKLGLEKGRMYLVEEEKSKEILNAITDYKTISVPGGSCANTMCTAAMLGAKCVYTGVVSDDMYGRLYENLMVESGVRSLIEIKDEGITGTSIILTTEDAERTMITYLGSCRNYTRDDINYEELVESKIFHCTGYQLDTEPQKEAVGEAIRQAKRAGLKVSFDIADPFCIERNVEGIKKTICEDTNILFGNRDEARMLTGIDDPVEAGKKIIQMGPEIVLIKVGSNGSYLFYDDKVVKIEPYHAEKVLDSTGCGDIFGAGFLYGYTCGYDLEICAKIASYMAAQIISVPCVQYQLLDFSKIKQFIENEIVK